MVGNETGWRVDGSLLKSICPENSRPRVLGDDGRRVRPPGGFVADVLGEKERQGVVLVVAGVHAAPQLIAPRPEGGIKLGFLEYRGGNSTGRIRASRMLAGPIHADNPAEETLGKTPALLQSRKAISRRHPPGDGPCHTWQITRKIRPRLGTPAPLPAPWNGKLRGRVAYSVGWRIQTC